MNCNSSPTSLSLSLARSLHVKLENLRQCWGRDDDDTLVCLMTTHWTRDNHKWHSNRKLQLFKTKQKPCNTFSQGKVHFHLRYGSICVKKTLFLQVLKLIADLLSYFRWFLIKSIYKNFYGLYIFIVIDSDGNLLPTPTPYPITQHSFRMSYIAPTHPSECFI